MPILFKKLVQLLHGRLIVNFIEETIFKDISVVLSVFFGFQQIRLNKLTSACMLLCLFDILLDGATKILFVAHPNILLFLFIKSARCTYLSDFYQVCNISYYMTNLITINISVCIEEM